MKYTRSRERYYKIKERINKSRSRSKPRKQNRSRSKERYYDYEVEVNQMEQPGPVTFIGKIVDRNNQTVYVQQAYIHIDLTMEADEITTALAQRIGTDLEIIIG